MKEYAEGIQNIILNYSNNISHIFNQLQEFVIIQDLEGKIIFANKSAADSVQTKQSEIIGKYCYNIWHNRNTKCDNCPVERSIYSRKTEESTIYSPDGRIWNIKGIPIINENKIQEVIEITREITSEIRMEELVQVNFERNEAIITAIPDYLFILNKEGKFLDLETSSRLILNYQSQDLIDKYIKDILPSELYTQVIECLTKVYETKKSQHLSGQIQLNNYTFYFDARFVLMGKEKILGIVRDITHQKEAERLGLESEIKYRELADLIPQAVFETDIQGNIIYSNLYGYELTGYNPKDLVKGLNIFDMVLLENKDEAKNNFKELLESKRDIKPNEYKLRKKNGDFYYALIYSQPKIKNKTIYGLRGIIIDITNLKKIEKELIESKEKAEESDRLKTTFLTNMSHEIRTPLNGILGLANLLKDEEINYNEKLEYIHIINERGNYLLHIINDIIDIAKIEANQIIISNEQIDLKVFINKLHSEFELEKQERKKDHIQLVIAHSDEIPFIFADNIRLKQILSNLFSNALKYTKNGSIKIGYEKTENNSIHFYVNDTGIGIAKEKHSLIFERFRQGDESYTRMFGGTGLGLSISKKMVELMEGNIWLESDENKGSTFHFTIPINKDSLNNNTDNFMENEENKTKNYNWEGNEILIVEDDYSSFRFLEAILKRTHAKILYASDGEQAIEMCQQNTGIDIILMDIQLPKLDGYTATKKIKEIRKNIPIIAQTAHAMEDDRKKSIKAGCDDYISKPIDKNQLLKIIDKYL